MANLQAAIQTIETGLKTKQAGQPVAVRIVAHISADHGRVEPLAAEVLAHATAWLGGESDRLTASGSVESGQITTLARIEGGQTALVSAGTCGVGRPLLAIEVWGNQGFLSWEDDRFEGPSHEELALGDKATSLLRRIQRSLKSHPVPASSAKTGTAAGRGDRESRRPPYGVLLVAGDHTHQPGYAEAFSADKRCRLVGLTDEANVSPRRKKLNEQLARRLDIPVLADLGRALARDDVQIVSICAEPIRRGRIAVLAAQAGKHLYLDKPLAASLQDADAMVTAVRKSGRVHHMFSQVHDDAADRVRRLVESDQLGDLTAIHFDLCFAKGPAGTAKLGAPREESKVPQRFELVESKRELSNVGVYPLVQLLSLVGRDVKRVTATTANYFFSEHQKNDMEDFGQMLLELEGGLVASISVGRTGWRSRPVGGLNRAFLIGTKGCTLVDAHRPRVEVWADVDPWTPPERNPEDPMGMWATPPGSPFTVMPRQSWITPPPERNVTDVSHFLDCIEHGRESIVSAEVAAAATEILMAGYRSAATGKTVTLPLQR
ncbi:MAG: Gfo/Idh/MocA family protein [Pirellulaceae bacterium]